VTQDSYTLPFKKSLNGFELVVEAEELLVDERDDKVPDLVVAGNTDFHVTQNEKVPQLPAHGPQLVPQSSHRHTVLYAAQMN
jgi:hypothetical protein